MASSFLPKPFTHHYEIDPKYAYLFDAPTEDPDGNKSILRFSRKSKEQYLITEKDGKATGWEAHDRDGAWKITDRGRHAT